MKKARWVLRIVLALVALVIIAVVVILLLIDPIAKAGIEKGGTYALGVPTNVRTVDLGLLGGTLSMDGLRVANPKGFKADHLLRTGRFDLKLDTGSLLSDTVVVNSFALDALEMNVEQTLSGNNIQPVLDHLKALGGPPGEPPAAEEKPGKKVQVDEITIDNVTATVSVMGQPPITLPVPAIRLTDVSTGGEGASIDQLVSRIMTAVLAAVLEEAQKAGVPMDITALKGQLDEAAAAMGGKAQEMVQQGVQQAEQEIRRQVTEGLGDILGGRRDGQAPTQPATAPAGVEEQLRQKATEGLGGLLGGRREEPNN